MANILDYIKWRGDLSLSASPFNEVDNLILAELCFIDFENIVPPPDEKGKITLRDAAEAFFEKHEGEKISLGLFVPSAIVELLREAAKSKRFSEIKLSAFVNIIDEEKEMQFSALTYHLTDKTKYIAFRGTDDTIVGWKEDFNMALMNEVPSQRAALEYLIKASKGFHKLRVGGHSKGGNLALYSSMSAPKRTRSKILAVYNNDGPGFRESVRQNEGYLSIKEKITSPTPYLSIVGSLLEHGENFYVVDSDGKGFFQHDGFNWYVMGNRFVSLPNRSNESLEIEKALKSWISSMTDKEKEEFITNFFKILYSTGAKTLSDINDDKLKSSYKMISTLLSLDKSARDKLSRAIILFFKERNAILKAKKSEAKQKSTAKKEEKEITASEFFEL